VPAIDRAVRLGLRSGFRRGLIGGNEWWLAILVVAVGARALQVIGARRPVVVTESLAPGQTLIVRHLLPAED
jgi:hypothetical protein